MRKLFNTGFRGFVIAALAAIVLLAPGHTRVSLAQEGNRAATDLSKAITYQTISFQDESKVDASVFRAFHKFLEETYPLTHKNLTREVVSDYSLLYKWEGSDPAAVPILLLAHMDVVPIEEGTYDDWTYPPFEGRIADGYIWGRGAMDDKDSLIAIMEAVEGLLEQGYKPTQTVYLAFGQDEEVGGTKGAVVISELLKSRGVKAEYVVDEGGFIVDGKAFGVADPVAAIGIAEKGYLSLQLKVRTGGGHSSMPPSHTAIGIMAQAITRLEKHPFPARLGGVTRTTFKYLRPELPLYMRLALANSWLLGGVIKKMLSKIDATNAMLRTTTAATIIEAGTKENVLPQEATAVVNFRLLPGDSVDYVISRVKKVINDPRVTVEILGIPREASNVTDINSKGFRKVEKTVEELFPGVTVVPFLVLGGTDSRFYETVSDCILRFVPMRAGPDDAKRAHGTNERISVDNFKEIIAYYTRLIKNGD